MKVFILSFICLFSINCFAQLNQATLLFNEVDVARARLEAIDNEKQEIFASYYMWDGDKIGGLFLAKLREKALQGVKVTIIIDGLGPMPWADAPITAAQYTVLRQSGVDIRLWKPASLYNLEIYSDINNFKNSHDKLLYLKSQNLLLTGDRNMQNINFRLQTSFGQRGKSYISSEMILKGPLTKKVYTYLKNVLPHTAIPPQTTNALQLKKCKEGFDSLATFANIVRKNPLNITQKLRPIKSIEYINQGVPRKTYYHPMDSRLIQLINSAHSEITFMTPYVRMPDFYLNALKAAIHKGVKVNFITASIQTSDVPGAKYIFYNQLKKLTEWGAKIYVPKIQDFMHVKSIIVDNQTLYLGSHNMNKRSTYLDLESGFIISDPSIIQQMQNFTSDFKNNLGVEIKVKKLGVVDMIVNDIVNSILEIPFIDINLK